MLSDTGRAVVVLCGPPGAGKTTAARASGLDVYDRDDPHWPDERTFRAALADLATDPAARAAVLRTGATSTARATACRLTGATHLYLLTAPREQLTHRVLHRADRTDSRTALAAITTWFDRHDLADGVELFPGWPAVDPQPNVPLLHTEPDPPPRRRRTVSRTGRPWSRIKARVLRRDGYRCHLCGRSTPPADTADHLIPVAHGGAIYDMNNLAAAHHDPCNRLRGDRPVEVARAELMLAEASTATELGWDW